MTQRDEHDFQQRLRRIDTLVQTLDTAADPAVRAAAQELVELLLGIHSAGLERLLDLVADTGEQGQALIDTFAEDQLASNLLILHGLHPLAIDDRVEQALDKVRPYLHSHGGDVELLGIEEGTVRLRLQGSCDGCPSSAITLKSSVESAIYTAAPDIEAILVEGAIETAPRQPAGFISMDQLLAAPLPARPAATTAVR